MAGGGREQGEGVRAAQVGEGFGLARVLGHDVDHGVGDGDSGREGDLGDGDPDRPELLRAGPALLDVEADARRGGQAHHDRGDAVAEEDADWGYGELERVNDERVGVGVVDGGGGLEVERHPEGRDAGEADVLEEEAEEG